MNTTYKTTDTILNAGKLGAFPLISGKIQVSTSTQYSMSYAMYQKKKPKGHK